MLRASTAPPSRSTSCPAELARQRPQAERGERPREHPAPRRQPEREPDEHPPGPPLLRGQRADRPVLEVEGADRSTGTISWAAVLRLEEDPHRLYVYQGVVVHVVPKSAMADPRAFVAEMRRLQAAALAR